MKKTILWILIACLSVGLMVGAYFLYQSLSERFLPDSLGDAAATTPPAEDGGDGGEGNGYLAPDFTVLTMDGQEASLSDYFGRPIVINFWATWCHYCVTEMPAFEEAYRAHPEVQFLMINVTDGMQETEATARAYLAEKGYTFPVFFDKKLDAYMTYAPPGLPFTLFLNAEGQLVTYASGAINYALLEKGIGMITD